MLLLNLVYKFAKNQTIGQANFIICDTFLHPRFSHFPDWWHDTSPQEDNIKEYVKSRNEIEQ